MHPHRKVPQAHEIGDMAARFANDPTQLFLTMAIVVDQPAIGFPLFPGIELFALNIFNQSNFKRRAIIKLFNDYRDLVEFCALRGAPAAFASNNLILPAQIPHDDRLKDAQRGYGARQFIQRILIKIAPRLIGQRLEAGDRHKAHAVGQGHARIRPA